MLEGVNLYGYYGMYLLGTVLMFAVSFLTYKKHSLKLWHAAVFTLVALVGGLSGTVVMGKIFSALLHANGIPGESNMAIYGAVMFTPLILLLVALISRQPWKHILDMVAPSGIIFTACAKMGCFFVGCCRGIECSFGVYSHRADATVFPSPVAEFITMIIIIIIGFWYIYKSDKFVEGTVYPIMGILYGGTRFFWEFLRHYDNEIERHMVFGMTLWQFCSIITVAVCIVWLLWLRRDWTSALKAKQLQRAEAQMLEIAEKKKQAQRKKKRK